MGVLHLALGNYFGMPAYVEGELPFPGWVGILFQKVQASFPLFTIALSAFNIAVIAQEFVRGVSARRFATARRQQQESLLVALIRLVDKNRRRYGGYVVHLGIICAFIGFAGNAWTIDHETSLDVNESFRLGDYSLTYRGSYVCPGDAECTITEQNDTTRQLTVTKVDVSVGGQSLGTYRPAQAAYQDMNTSEVAIRRGIKDDLYMAVRSVNPTTQRAMFEFHANPLVWLIWFGSLVMILGASISLWPEMDSKQLGAWRYVRSMTTIGSFLFLSIYLTLNAQAPPH
jgi:cytochrome c-type biogenesis protein CcmF